MSNRLPVLAENIRRAHADVQEAAKTAAERAIEAGHSLIEAKSLVKHGQWLPWLRDHCALAERTAQLYMKIARSGHSAELVSQLGLQAAERALIRQYCFHQPLYDGDHETRREWWCFALFLTDMGFPVEHVQDHIDWIGRKDFKTVEEWLAEGPKWVRTWGGNMADLRADFSAFRTKHENKSVTDFEAFLEDLAKPKSATVADMGGAA